MISSDLSFADFNISPLLLNALRDMGFDTPSPVQAEAIPLLLEGRDVIAKAQTGTGKTAAFAIPILEKIKIDKSGPQALILAPTRELAIQVGEQFRLLSKYHKGLTIATLCGGQEYRTQLKALREGAQVIVGTPGRILDHLDRKSLDPKALKMFVLDEADEMLRMGFIEDVEKILALLHATKRHIAMFSATMPPRIRSIAEEYLQNPARVDITMPTETVDSIEQHFLFVNYPKKVQALVRILSNEEYQSVIVFVKTKNETEEVAQSLQKEGYQAIAMHGDITQSFREKIIAQFRQGSIPILVATDVAARGLDVERVTHVNNRR